MKESESLHFTGTIWRPPFEAHSVLLQVTVGCTHHACKFCSLYGDLRFRISPAEEVEADLRIVARYQPRARRVFLVGANPFVLSAGRLIRLADRIRDFLPKVRTIGMFARVSDILQKSAAEPARTAGARITGISIGTESGDDASLAFMNKGNDRGRSARSVPQTRRGGHRILPYLHDRTGRGRQRHTGGPCDGDTLQPAPPLYRRNRVADALSRHAADAGDRSRAIRPDERTGAARGTAHVSEGA